MKLLCTKNEFLTHLTKLVTVTEKGIEENYAYVYLLAKEGKVQLIAQDEVILLFLSTENVEVEEEGEIRIHASTLWELVKRLPQDQFSVSVTGDDFMVGIRAGDFEADFKGLEFQDIPLAKREAHTEFSIHSSDLKGAIHQTWFTASPSISGRTHVEGVRFSLNNSRLMLTGTDARRIGITIKDLEAEPQGKREPVVIPRDSLYKLMHLLEASSGTVLISFSHSTVSFRTQHMMFISRLLAEAYPDCDQFFQQDWTLSISLNRLKLRDSLDRVLQIKDEETGGILLGYSNKRLSLSSERRGFGRTRQQLPTTFVLKDFEFRCLGKSLFEILVHMDCETVKLSFNSSLDCCRIVPEEVESPKYLIMGMLD